MCGASKTFKTYMKCFCDDNTSKLKYSTDTKKKNYFQTKNWSAIDIIFIAIDIKIVDAHVMESTESPQKQQNPRERANLLSILLFTYTIPLFRKGYSKDLELNDIDQELKCDKSETLGNRLEAWVQVNSLFTFIIVYL